MSLSFSAHFDSALYSTHKLQHLDISVHKASQKEAAIERRERNKTKGCRRN